MASIGDILAGRAVVSLELKPIEKWGKQLAQMSRRLKSAAMQMGTSAIVMSTPFIAGARVFANFSKQMAFVATMLDEPQKHMQKFTREIRLMSIEFGESTETLSRGLYDILSAGFAPIKALDMLAVTTKAAKAGMTDAASSTQAIIAVLNAYSLSAEHATEVSDALFMTVKKGVLTYGELAGHIGMVASTASAAGVELNEMLASIAVITRGGVETSHAIVALNNILKAFLSPTGASAELAKSLEKFGVGPITLKGIEEKGFLRILKEIIKLPPDIITGLLPSLRAARGIFALRAQIEKIDDVFRSFLQAAGSTDEALLNITKTFGHLIDRLKQSGILILNFIGEALSESLRDSAKEVLLVAAGFGEWIKQNKSLISTTANLIIKLGALAVTLLVVSKVLGVVSVMLALISGPGGLVRLAVMAVGAIAAWSLLKSLVTSVKNELKSISDIGKGMSDKGNIVLVAIGFTEEEIRSRKLAALKKKIKDETKIFNRAISRGGEGDKGLAEVQASILQQRNKEKRALQKIVDSEKDALNAIKSRRSESKNVTTEMEKQAKAMGNMSRIGNQGFFLGFQHTPVLAFSSKGSIQENQLSALDKIAMNTSKEGDIVVAIEGIGKAN